MPRKKKKDDGGLFDAIGDVVEGVGDAVGGVVDAVGDAAGDVVDTVTESVDTTYEAGSTAAAQKSAAEAQSKRRERAAKATERRAARRQRSLVNKYVTKAYTNKLGEIQSAPSANVGERIDKAKQQVESLRAELLNHPAVEDANSRGKVVPPKGLQKLRERAEKPAPRQDPFAVEAPNYQDYQRRERQREQIRGLLQIQPDDLEPRRRRAISATGDQGKGEEQYAPDPHALVVARDFEAPAQEAGVLPKEKTFGQKAYQRVAEYGPAVLGFGPEITAATKGLQAVLKGVQTGGAKVGGSALTSPVRAASPGQQAAVVTRAAERAAAPRVSKVLGRQGKADRAVARQLTGTQSRREFSSQAGLGLQGVKAGAVSTPEKARAIAEGAGEAITEGGKETLDTTLRALPAAVTGPAALLYSAGRIPFEGTGPIEETAKAQWEGLEPLAANLLSGDPERTQTAFEKEGAFSLLTGIPAITRTRGWAGARSATREAAAGVRRTTKLGRQTPKGVEANVFGHAERRGQRKRTALLHARTSNAYRVSEGRHTDAVKHNLAKAPKGSHVLLQTAVEYGLRGPRGVALLRQRGPKTEPNVEGKVNLDQALRYAEENPGVWKDKHFKAAVAAGDRASRKNPAALADSGEVARHRPQGDLFGIRPPEDRVPAGARQYTSATTREGAWKHVEALESRLTSLKSRQRERASAKRRSDDKRKTKSPASPKAPRRTKEVKALEGRIKALKKELDPYTRPGQKSARGERMFWDKGLEREYTDEVRAAREGSPLEDPAWTHHTTFLNSKLGIESDSLPSAPGGGTQHVRRGRYTEEDLVDRSAEAFVRGTIQLPRRRMAGTKFAQEFVRRERLPYRWNGETRFDVPDSQTWAAITGKKTKDNPNGGQFDPDHFRRFPVRQWGSAAKNPFTKEGDLEALLAEAEAGRVGGHEPSVIVPRESVKEFAAAVNPKNEFTEHIAKFSTGASRLILSTNPSWAIAQIPAEGIPILLAHPELLNPGKVALTMRDVAAFRRKHPEEAATLEGVVGASPHTSAGSLRNPQDLVREGSYNPQPKAFDDAAKELTRGPIGRAFKSGRRLEWLGLFDVKRQNAYRAVLLAAEADKQFRGFSGSVHGLFRQSSKLSEKFNGKSREDLWIWLTTTKEGRAELDKLADYVDNIQGNWTAFTRFERSFAPFVIFYPFLRYSLRWALWTFPRTHPVTATIAMMLGQSNSNQLEKLLGAKPATPYNYSFPVVRDEEGKAEFLPGGARISPGQSAVQQAIATGEAPQLLSAVNPFLGAANVLLGGVGPFGQTPDGPAGFAAIDQIMQLPAPFRALDITSEDILDKFGIVRTQPQSVIDKAFEKLDPDRAARGFWNPLAPQSAKNLRMANELSLALRQAERNSKTKQSEIAGDDSLTVKERQKIIQKMKRESTDAGNRIDKVLKKLGLPQEAAEAYERFKAAMYGGEKDSGIYGKGGGIYDKGAIYESGGIYGGKSQAEEKALKYRPPKPGGIELPGIPSVSGAIPDFLGGLIGGTPAQAATRPKGSKGQMVANTRQAKPVKPLKQGDTGKTALDLDAIGKGFQFLKAVPRKEKERQVVKRLTTLRKKAAANSEIEGYPELRANKAGQWILRASKKYDVDPSLLASIYDIETASGTNLGAPTNPNGGSEAGAMGPMQFMPQTWEEHGVRPDGSKASMADIMKTGPSMMSAAAYLKAAGYQRGNPDAEYNAIFSYNHAGWYVEDVQANQAKYKGLRGASLRPKDPKLAQELKAVEARADKLGIKLNERRPAGGPKMWKGRKTGPMEGYVEGLSRDTSRLGRRIAGISGEKLDIISGIRPGDTVESGEPSDHASGQALDIGVLSRAGGGTLETEQKGDRIATAAYIAAGGKANDPEWTSFLAEGGAFDVISPSGYRVQIIWKTPEWGGHEDHVHVGIRPEEGAAIGSSQSYGGGSAGGYSVGGSMPVATGSAAPVVTLGKNGQKKSQQKAPAKTASERLALVNEITSGEFGGLGIPGYESGPRAASATDLASLGRTLEDERRKLLTL